MPIKSMTGFGQGSAVGKGIKVNVELSSVNRKQLDVHLRLPRELQLLEPRLMTLIQKQVARGRINGEISLQYSGGVQRSRVAVDRKLAAEYLAEMREAARVLGMADNLQASMLLNLPGVVALQENQLDTEEVGQVVEKALEKALKALVAMRKTEGAALKADLENRLQLLQKGLQVIKERAPVVAEKYHRDLQNRLAEAGFDLPDDEGRLIKEVAFFADRSDITEEIVRLKSHFKQVSLSLRSTKPVGRSLDFLAQEMFREINTIGSKGNDTAIINEVVAFKAELERFREQVQNIE